MKTVYKTDILSRLHKEITLKKSLMMPIKYIELDDKEWDEFLKAAEREYPRFCSGADKTFMPIVKDEYEAFYDGTIIRKIK